ncbi:MAG: methylated-DNA--[protein]-cysteine S-methyltransferase [Nitrospiraceae bacterium]|nr:MAG: methylated-DNA--[protein]-cysteine S-methyltransferase [Nitrospiraceae bacterium]
MSYRNSSTDFLVCGNPGWNMSKPSLCYDVFDSPVGTLYLVFSGRQLTGVSFDKPERVPYKKGAAPGSFIKELADYFGGVPCVFNQEIKFLTGTDFEKKVWTAIMEVPFGETRSYKWVAAKTGSPAAVRAVGRALSKNPVPVIIPCHRVIESDGSIGGYSSGVDVKRRLLDMEYYAEGK